MSGTVLTVSLSFLSLFYDPIMTVTLILLVIEVLGYQIALPRIILYGIYDNENKK